MPNQPQGRYSEPDNRDWRGRPAQFTTSGEDRSWETLRENKEFGNRFDSRQQDANQHNRQDQLSNQFGRTQISSNQGVINILEESLTLYCSLCISCCSQLLCKDILI